MLSSLSIRDIVLIDRLDLDLGAGLCVLTGETGAGKSILLDALGLATGNRADKALVRHGQNDGSATAVFELGLGHPALARLNQADLMEEGETLAILRRVQRADGPSRAYVNDRPVSVGLLQELGGMVLEIHGQHDARGLLDPGTHRGLLDAFGGHTDELHRVRQAFHDLAQAREALEARRAQVEADARDRAYLEHVAEELAELDPQEGEEDQLAAARTRAMNAEKISGDLAAAANMLREDGGLESKAAEILKRLERIEDQAPGTVTGAVEVLSRLLDDAAEAEGHVTSALGALEVDEHSLDQVEERLFALRAAARKHRVQVDQLRKVLDDARARLAAVQSAEELFDKEEARVLEAEGAFTAAAKTLRDKRTAAAGQLDEAVTGELAPLKLEKARFRTTLSDAPAGPEGIDQIRFEVATNPGAPFGALHQVASGGEMSRFALALKVALAATGGAGTLIFDEIDQGVGGAVADAIGERLARLAAGGDAQVIVVTHSPQIAAKAQTHWRVSKTAKGKATTTRIEVLDESARREEVARMLSAADITDEARAAADRLLARSGKGTGGKGTA